MQFLTEFQEGAAHSVALRCKIFQYFQTFSGGIFMNIYNHARTNLCLFPAITLA